MEEELEYVVLEELRKSFAREDLTLKTLKIYNYWKNERCGFRQIKNYDEVYCLGSKECLDLLSSDKIYQSQDIINILRKLYFLSDTLIISTDYPFINLIIPSLWPKPKKCLLEEKIKCFKVTDEELEIINSIEEELISSENTWVRKRVN